MNENAINKLLAPFPYEEVEAKIQVTTGDKSKGMAVFYLTSRAIQGRLDEIIGSFNWSNSFYPWQEKAQICGISIYNEERREWITKYDGADNSDIEAIKGGLSDAFKRSAVLWGIGRYLYQIYGVWVEIEQRGNSHCIKDNQQNRLKAAYEAAVKKIFSVDASATGSSNQQQQSSIDKSTQQIPSLTTQQGRSNMQQSSVPQTSNNEVKPIATTSNIYDFRVQSIKPSGKSSQLLELRNGKGEITLAYVKSGDEGIAVGAQLRSVQIEKKNNSYGAYNLVTSYKLAA